MGRVPRRRRRLRQTRPRKVARDVYADRRPRYDPAESTFCRCKMDRDVGARVRLGFCSRFWKRGDATNSGFVLRDRGPGICIEPARGRRGCGARTLPTRCWWRARAKAAEADRGKRGRARFPFVESDAFAVAVCGMDRF